MAGARVSELMLALYEGRKDAVDAILARDPKLDVFEAAALGRVERLHDLLDADPDSARARYPDTFTPLHFAAFFAQPEAARLLLERGAEVDAVAAGFSRVTPLHSAAAAGQTAIAALLLEHGADPNAVQEGGFTPIHAAAQNGDAELVRMLLARGADPSGATDDGRTPLDLAADDEVRRLL